MVLSKKQLAANRRNALRSTGPKDTSLTRLNALKHGLLSKEVLIEGEDKKIGAGIFKLENEVLRNEGA